MELEEAIKIFKEDLEHTKKANECGLATKGEFNKEIEAIEFIINHITKQEKMIDLMTNFIYHIGYYEDSYGNSCAIIQDSCFKNKTTESCEQCIKQYFEKKAEESE